MKVDNAYRLYNGTDMGMYRLYIAGMLVRAITKAGNKYAVMTDGSTFYVDGDYVLKRS